jgi:hypothetical protein
MEVITALWLPENAGAAAGTPPPAAAGGGVTEELAPAGVRVCWKLLLLGWGNRSPTSGRSRPFTPTESAPYKSLIIGGTGRPVSSSCCCCWSRLPLAIRPGGVGGQRGEEGGADSTGCVSGACAGGDWGILCAANFVNTAGVVDAASRGCDRGAGLGTAVCGWDLRTWEEGHTSAAWMGLQPPNFQAGMPQARCAAGSAAVLPNWKLPAWVPCCDASAGPCWLQGPELT